MTGAKTSTKNQRGHRGRDTKKETKSQTEKLSILCAGGFRGGLTGDFAS